MRIITDKHILSRKNNSFWWIMPFISSPSGIYKIKFGDKFYIGKAIDIKQRLMQHRRIILRHIKREEFGTIGVYYKIMRHLWLHPRIIKAEVTVIEYCPETELTIRERHWLQRYYANPKCLNHASYL